MAENWIELRRPRVTAYTFGATLFREVGIVAYASGPDECHMAEKKGFTATSVVTH